MVWLASGVSAVLGIAVGLILTYRARQARFQARENAVQAEVAALRRAAGLEAESERLAALAETREQVLQLRTQLESELSERALALARREERIAKKESAVLAESAEISGRMEALGVREREIEVRTALVRQGRADAAQADRDVHVEMERRAGLTRNQARVWLSETWIEEAKAEAENRLRGIDQDAADPEHTRQAKRIMGIAVQRYKGHYLTERLLSIIALTKEALEHLTAQDNLLLSAIAEAAGVTIEVQESGERVRIEAQDGVAREVARRALQRIVKGPPRGPERDPRRWIGQIAATLDREIIDLGKRAFAELELPKAHPEIVQLVGRLNYRTSYTQNQWKHAIEAAFLGGMMAGELGLEVKLARRATLLHDIGKSLSHEIEGSHAVIGADLARRHGETEVVANAIGAHHADEAPASVYAYLVAAADAMSGGRPGARREQTVDYASRIGDLERIGASFRGVDRAIAVQGGRELRVYVREDQVDDLRAVALSQEIACSISDQLIFPGQIRVTVIRAVEAVAIAS